MNHLQQRNLECFLAWQEKYRRGFVARDAWSPAMRTILGHHYWKKLETAREWLATKRVRRRAARTMDCVVCGIWSAKSSLARRG